MTRMQHRVTQICRMALIVTFGALCWWKDEVDDQVEWLWRVCKDSALFRHDSFEPFVVTVGFVLSLSFFYILDVCIPSAWRWRIHKDVTVKGMWKTQVRGRLCQETVWYWTPLALFDWIYPRRSLPVAPPTFWTLALEVLAALMVYDALFFCFHLLFHKVPLLYKRFHAKHHTMKAVHACEALHLTLVEEVVDVGCSIAAINLLRCHPLSRAFYNFIIVYLITELHSGYDFPWMLQNVVPFGLWAGSVRHDYHHCHGTRYYQKFFTYLDDLHDYFTEGYMLHA